MLPTGGPRHKQTQAPSRVCCLVLPHILLEDSRSGWHSLWGHFPAQGQVHLLESQARQDKCLGCTSLGHGTIYVPFPAPASTYWPPMEGPWLDKPFSASDLGCLQNWLDTQGRADKGSLASSSASHCSWDRLCITQDIQGLQKKHIPQRPSHPTFLCSHLHKEHREPLRQPSQMGFSLLASSSSLEGSIVAPLISTPGAAPAPQHKHQHLQEHPRKSI